MQNIDKLTIDTLRMLSIDQIEAANSGHPGLPMGAAPMAYALWAKVMRHNPANPEWFNRDRFVLSAGHGSALLYSLLHVFRYAVSIEDLKQFRQWGSRTPGHPEVKHTPGVEATTGPLGQGISSAVGMAMVEAHLGAKYNRPALPIVDHYTYVLCSDGDLMEGVASEACSLAGHLKLGKLIALYDSNQISLDGDLGHAFSESVRKRFESYGWQVLHVEDGNDVAAIEQAIRQGQQEKHRPTLIEINTIIGFGSPNRGGTSEAHGKPLGVSERLEVVKAYQWSDESAFHVPEAVKQHTAQWLEQVQNDEAKWQGHWAQYQQSYPQLAEELQRAMDGQLPRDWNRELPRYAVGDKAVATRSVSGAVLQTLAENIPNLFGGSADLASSNNTMMKQAGRFDATDYTGRNIWFGVREHGMGAILNGMLLHGGVKAFGATFLVFSDYLRPSIRLAALSKLPVIYIFTHDSIAVGEDGPTHEPVEQIPSLRLIPNLRVIRPADANETVAAWEFALQQQSHPVALILSRQNLPILKGSVGKGSEMIEQGAYVVSEADTGYPQGIIMATGSEVSLAIEAQKVLKEKGYAIRVISMPCRERFDQQSADTKEWMLPSRVKVRVAIEAAHPMGWERYVGDEGIVIGIDQFGASAPGDRVMKEYGFAVDHVVERVEKLIQG